MITCCNRPPRKREVHEKFKLESGVPVRTGAKAKASDKAFKKKRSSSRISSRVSTISLTSKPGPHFFTAWLRGERGRER